MLSTTKALLSRARLSLSTFGVLPAQNLHTSAVLCGAPLKKKRRQDPALIRMQLERKRKRIEKQIRQAAKFARKLKPVDECEIHRDIPKASFLRKPESDVEVKEEKVRRLQLEIEWSQYKSRQTLQLFSKFADMISAQEKALNELKLENPALYDKAVEKDVELLPYKYTGPTETPPIPNYIQDGQYTETTKSYELNPEIVKLMLGKNELAQRMQKRR